MLSEDIIPKVFEFRYGSVLNLLHPHFELKDNKFVEDILFYRDCTHLDIKPTEEQWIEFWNKMEEIDIWNWNEYYSPLPDRIVMDGISWRIKIVHDDHRIESGGSNAYPDGFEKFVKAFKDLTGINIVEEDNRRWDMYVK